MAILDAKRASELGDALLQCGAALVRRKEVLDDPEALAAIARQLAAGLQELEGALGRVVLPRPRAADDGCGSPFVGASAATGPGDLGEAC